MRWSLTGLSLWIGIVAVTLIAASGRSRPDDRDKNPEKKPKAYLRVGHSFTTYTGPDDVRGDVTAFSGVRVKELELGLVVLKGGKETVLDERTHLVNDVPHRLDGIVSLQYVATGTGKARRYELRMGGGIANAENRIPKSTRKPTAVTIERIPLSHYSRLGEMASETLHIVRVDIIEGEITKEGSYLLRGHPLSGKVNAEKTLTLDKLKELSRKAEQETLMVTTLRWKGYE